jgi:hypothetical protein
VLQWIVSQALPRYSQSSVCAAAARGGRPHVMEWLSEAGFRPT